MCKKAIEDSVKKDAIDFYPMRETASILGLTGSLKRQPKYALFADVLGSLISGLMRLPPEYKALGSEDKQELQAILKQIPVALEDFASAMESDPNNIYGVLERLALLADDIREETEKLSKKLPKMPTE